jgi:hypothetical protein
MLRIRTIWNSEWSNERKEGKNGKQEQKGKHILKIS